VEEQERLAVAVLSDVELGPINRDEAPHLIRGLGRRERREHGGQEDREAERTG
jgi:hypothetical protein